MSRCACGKYRYFTRKAAKRAMRRLYPDRNNHGRLNAYECRIETNVWHLGHLPEAVKRGDVGRDQIITKPRNRTTA